MNKVNVNLKEIENKYKSITSSDELIERLEDEVNNKRQLLEQVMPKELQQVKHLVNDLNEISRLSASASLSDHYLNNVKEKINTMNKEMNTIIEKKMLNSELLDDKLALFRENVSCD